MTTGPRRTEGGNGFTLIELMVTVVVNVVVFLGVLALLQGQQRSFQRGSHDRALQDRARLAMSDLTMALRRAGYGMDPAFAFDFGPVANFAQIQDRPDRPPVASLSHACGAAVACRDNKADGTDEVVFYARDPYFSRLIQPGGVSSGAISLTQGLPAALSQGQVLLVICQGGGWRAYVTVGAPAAAGSQQIILTGEVGTSFPRQGGLLGEADGRCLRDSGTTAVYKIDRFRYFVQGFPEPGGTTRPWLMLDRGLANANGAAATEPVAPDIEDVQFAYVFPNATAAVGQSAGAAPGNLANAPAGIDLTAGAPTYEDAAVPPSLSRQTHHPANIRSVQVALVARAPIADAKASGINVIPAALNRLNTAGPTGFDRYLLVTSVATRNLESRGPVSSP